MRKECKRIFWDNICAFLSDPITNPIYSIKKHTLLMLEKCPIYIVKNKEKKLI